MFSTTSLTRDKLRGFLTNTQLLNSKGIKADDVDEGCRKYSQHYILAIYWNWWAFILLLMEEKGQKDPSWRWMVEGRREAPNRGPNYTSILCGNLERSDKGSLQRIDQTRNTDSLHDCRFHYGFNSNYLRKVTSYWRHEFNWERQVTLLNKYPHFKTNIEGIDVHFVHVKPVQHVGQKVLPLMMVHGWPGSFFEFCKILLMLTKSEGPVVFEVICPSIPGYGFSEAPHVQGFNSIDAARVFYKLMERQEFSEYYVQGGDWGSLITSNMAQMKPECVKGLHLNMIFARAGRIQTVLSFLIGRYLPFLVGFTREDVRHLFPYMQTNVYELLQESGYMHIQATKPDTAGCAVNDSPVGLAAYILEKFSTWTDFENRDLEDGGLERKFRLDDLLTNIMIYWTTGTIIPSMRFYKENIGKNFNQRVYNLTNIYVPTGLAAFPHELMHCPWARASSKFRDIRSYTYIPRGGHFAAFEEPALLAQDIMQFVNKVEGNKV